MVIRHDAIGDPAAAANSDHMITFEAIKARRNVREYDNRPMTNVQLDQILEAGRRSPSSQNSQPWDFVVVTDEDQLRRLSAVWFGGAHIAGSAATVALVVAAEDAARSRVQFDLGQATMSMMLAAAAFGVGSCHSAVGDHELARELLAYPADKTCALLISFGYPVARPLAPIHEPDRRPFDDVVHCGRW
ncbi:MAG TPA: nitroreductase family protein [Streptosporangiaceae bacterium]|nr:nitroreductase family protein [Streptosporangiaceae bacterium]